MVLIIRSKYYNKTNISIKCNSLFFFLFYSFCFHNIKYDQFMNLQKIKNKQMKIFMSKAARPNEKTRKRKRY